MMDSTFKKFIGTVGRIADNLKDDEQLVLPALVQGFREQARRAGEYAEEIMTGNRDLKIGIVGQVKAGKSSFLNALVFDGKDILPKAATPMTAALTKIAYAQHSSAKVVFYSKVDWNAIEQAAEKYDEEYRNQYEKWKKDRAARLARVGYDGIVLSAEPSVHEIEAMKNRIFPQWTSCKELVEMAANNSDILIKLDSEEDVSIENMEQDLEQYVGAKGKYTPIVKYIEIGIANELLKDIQIVDTPGLGDPIRSRSEKTKEFLMACDVVFLLSPTSQFMSREDVDLMMNTLPNESIHRAVIVGSQFDLALLDDSARGRQSLIQVIRRTRDKLNENARRVIAESRKAETGYVHSRVLTFIQEEVMKQIQEEKSLYYTSSILYRAVKYISNGEALGDDVEHILSSMEKRFVGMKREPGFLLDLAGIDRLREKEFTKIKEEKEAIIADRGKSFMSVQLLAFQKQLNEIQMEGEQNLQIIKTEDIGSLQRKLKMSQEALRSMRRDIQNAFEGCAADTKKYIVIIAQDVKARASGHTDIKIAEEKNVTHHSDTEGMLFWKKKVRWTETEYYKAANVEDVIGNIHNYIKQAESDIAANLDKAIEIDAVRKKIKDIVLRAFQKADADFDENDIIGPLEVVLKRLTIPDFTVLDRKKYEQQILTQFPSARVKGEAISDLKLKQTLLLEAIAGDVSAALEKKANEIAHMLETQAVNFTDEIKQEIEGKIESLSNSLQDRKGSIAKYEAFLVRIDEGKKLLREFA